LLSHCPPANTIGKIAVEKLLKSNFNWPALANLPKIPFRRYRLLSLNTHTGGGHVNNCCIVVCGEFKAFCGTSWHIASIVGIFILPMQRGNSEKLWQKYAIDFAIPFDYPQRPMRIIQ
jgi:hypothetical protein